MMRALLNDLCLTAHLANNASLRCGASQHHFCRKTDTEERIPLKVTKVYDCKNDNTYYNCCRAASKAYERINCLVEMEDFLQYASHKEEVYWKDNSMLDIYFEIDILNPITETEWIQLFDQHLKHYDTFKDNTFLEICHYSEVGNRNDPFVIAYIPLTSIKENI